MNITVRVTGQAELLKAIREVNAKIEKQTEEALDQASASTVVDVQARSPVRTGKLRNSYRQLARERLKCVIGTDTPYAPFLEFGTVKMNAQPHLFPAFERNRVLLLRMLKSMRL